MAATPYPHNLLHVGSARALTLDVQLDVPPSGDILIYTKGNATSSGWQAIPGGQKMVVTVGRGTQYEAKYLVSSITFAATVTTMRVLAVDRDYDGVPPTVTPAGTVVEHTVSATEMATINDHMRTRIAHGSDGSLVDEQSAQVLRNKTLEASTLIDPVLSQARFTPVGAIMMWPVAQLPVGFLACDGKTFSAAEYPDLAARLGGTTLPNLNDAFVKGGDTPNLAQQGQHSRTLTIDQMPQHKHDVTVSASQSAHSHGDSTGPGGKHSHPFSGNTGNTQGYTAGTADQYNNLTGNGARSLIGYNPVTLIGIAHTHPFSGTTAEQPDHGHTIAPDTPAITTAVGETNLGGGQAVDIQPKHVVVRYIICAKAQGT